MKSVIRLRNCPSVEDFLAFVAFHSTTMVIRSCLTGVELLQGDQRDRRRQRPLDLGGGRRRQQPRVRRHLQHRGARVAEQKVGQRGVALLQMVQLKDPGGNSIGKLLA